MKRILIFALVSLPLSAVAGADALSRAQAVALALGANPTLRKTREDLNILEGRKQEALADALPELELLGNFNRYRDPGLLNSPSFDAFPPDLRESLNPSPASLWEGTAHLKQTLWSFKVGRAVKAARLGIQYGREQIRGAQQDVSLLAVQVYNEHLLAIEQLRVAGKAVRQKEEHLKMAQNRYAAGVATELDVLRSNVDLENQRTQLLRFRGRAEITRSRLNAVMVRPIDTPIEPTDSLAYVPLQVPVEEAVRVAWENRPEAKAVALNEQIRDTFVGIAKAEHRPSLDLEGNWGYSVRQLGNFAQGDFQKWNLGISLKIPLFDGFRTAGKVAQARAERAKVTQDRIALENDIRLEAKDAWDRLSVAKSIYEAAELNVQQAQKALDMTQANYNYGVATLLDVLDAQAALTLAESTRVEALYEHANARARMRYVMARDVLDTEPAVPAIVKTGDR